MLTEKIEPTVQQIPIEISTLRDPSPRDEPLEKLLPEQRRLLSSLIESGCILLGKEAKEQYGLNTPIYFDLRANLYEHPELLWMISRELLRVLHGLLGWLPPRQKVVGIPETGIPLALAAALYAWREERHLDIRFGLLRSREKVYPGGQRESYLGEIDPAVEYTLIDDVIASGATKIKCISRLSELGCQVKRIVVLVDREQGGSRRLRELGVAVNSIFRLSDVIKFLCEEGYISTASGLEIIHFMKSHQF